MKEKHISYLHGWKGNVVAIIFALLLAWIVFFVAQNNNSFFADIAGGENTPVFSEQGDIGVSLQSTHTLRVQLLKHIPQVDSVSILLLFDPTEIHLDNNVFASDFSWTYAPAGEGQGELILHIGGDLENTTKLFHVSSPALDITKIVVGDTVVHFADGSTESLSVETK